MVGRGPAGHRERPEGQTRHLGHVPPAGRPGRLHHRQPALRRTQRVDLALGVPRLGLAHPVPAYGAARGRLPLRPTFPARDPGLPAGRPEAADLEGSHRSRLRQQLEAADLGTFIMLATYVIFYFMTAFTLTYGTAPASPEQAQTAAEAAGKTFDPTGFVAGLG